MKSLFACGLLLFFYGRVLSEADQTYVYMKGGIEFSSLDTRHDGCGNCRGGGYCHRQLQRFGHMSRRESIVLALMFELYYRLLV